VSAPTGDTAEKVKAFAREAVARCKWWAALTTGW
jgi:hypothetical protein